MTESHPPADRVVVCVFDGLRPDMVTPGLTPNLVRLASCGVWHRQARGVFPSVTRVATTSIATGATPAVHGVVGNAFLFPEVTRDHVLDTGLGADIALAERATGGRLVTAPTFGDLLAAAGKRLAVVHTGSAGSAHLINPRARANGHWTFSILGREGTQTPDAVDDVIARFGPLPPRSLPRFEEIAYAGDVFTEHVLGHLRPDVALIWFNEPDTSGHYRGLGHPETLAVLGQADAAFGRILDAIEARPDRDRFAVIAASDHGQISTSAEVDLAGLLSAEGHAAGRAAHRNLAGARVALTGGAMGEIRVLDGDLSRRDAIARWIGDQPFLGALFSPARNEVEGEAPGSFALSIVGLDHARAPHLAFAMRSGEEPDPWGRPGLGLFTGGVPVGGAMHGGLNRFELNTLLILAAPGAGLAGGRIDDAPCGIIDIAPTILGLLGIPPAPTMQGLSLAHPRPSADIREIELNGRGFRQRLVVADIGRRRILLSGGAVA